MTREELIEVMAQAMLEDELSVDPHSYFATVWANESDIWLSNAKAALAALEAAGVRLVPVDPDDNQLAAGMESDSISHPWEALGVYRQMLAASPYALKETGQ
jgi:hypothetical protein